MANLNRQDKEWLSSQLKQNVDDAIANAIEVFRPHGWRRVTQFLREWSLAATAIAVPVALLGIALAAAYVATARVGKEAAFETNTTRDLQALNQAVSQLQIQHSTQVIQPGSKAPPNEIGEAATQLQEKQVKLPRADITQTAQSLVRDASVNQNAAAWDAATKTLGYISFLNTQLAPSLNEEPNLRWGQTTYEYPPGWQGTAHWVGTVAAPEVPEFHPLGSPNKNAALTSGPAYLVLTGGVLKLDGWVLKRIVVVNATIVYEGGPVRMDNVYFVNCKFSIAQQKNTEEFAQALLAPDARTDFSAPSAGM